MNLTSLKELGLTEGQVKVYQAVLELGISSLNNIHEKTGTERRNIYDILNKLIEKGLISYTLEKGKRTYQCTHPNTLKEEIHKKKAILDNLEKELPSIQEFYTLARPEIGAEVYRGNEAIKTLLNEILANKESYWMGGNSFEHYTAVPKNLQVYWEHWMERRAKKKHLMHDLVSYGTWLRGLEPNNKAKHKEKHYRYCSLPKGMYTPLVIVIFGNKVAQVLWAEQSFAFLLESKKIKESFMKYFHFFWKKGT